MLKRDKHFPFDIQTVPEFKHVNVFAVSDDRRTFYVNGGLSGGVRFRVDIDEVGEYFISDRLHPDALVKVNDSDIRFKIERMLRYVADNRLPSRLIPIREIGFEPISMDRSRHQDGWYTLSDYALEIVPPDWAMCEDEEVRAYDIREGIYVVFSDGSYRLIPKREYYETVNLPTPLGRQGDCLLFDATQVQCNLYLSRHAEPCLPWAVLDRHEVVDVDGNTVIQHPEHDAYDLSSEHIFMLIAPGTSRPFRQSIFAD